MDVAPSEAVGLDPETATIHYRDARGYLQEIRVTSSMARAIRNVRQRARRADERWREKHRAMTDVELEAEALASQDRPRLPPPTGEAWQGPRYSFVLLLGLGIAWPPPRPGKGRACPGCGDARLAPICYCTVCDASGMDHMITPPTRAELKLKRCRQPRRDGLAGGTEAPKKPPPKAKPKPAPPPPKATPRPKARKPKPPREKAAWVREYERLRGAAKGEPS